MENTNAAQAASELAQLKDLEMAGFVEAAKDPLWLWPLIGVLAGGFLASFEMESAVVTAVAIVSYILGIAIIVGLVVRRRGVQPRMNDLPAPLKRVWAFYGVGVAVASVTIVGLGFGVSWIYAGIAAFVIVTVGGVWYHVSWRSAVDSLVAA